jgi:hypothetical protein
VIVPPSPNGLGSSHLARQLMAYSMEQSFVLLSNSEPDPSRPVLYSDIATVAAHA